jgi:transposase
MSNNKTRQVYTSEFKREAIELARTSGKPVTALEQELGLSQGLLKYWIRQAKAEGETAFPGQGRLKPADEELRRLQREVEILRQERDLLKKVVAIFSHDPPRNTRS